ncbi:MAG TPA: DUF2306 domain-containing protein [Rhodobacterales bacterium]|nr:DUF2306 domain-containing protein [Rhodobacterales bacterium]
MTQRLMFLSATILSLLVALMSYRFLALGLGMAFPDMGPHIDFGRIAFLAHVSAAPVALALGMFQFAPRIRQNRPGLHLWMGRLYGVAILIAGLGALAMTPTDNGGLAAKLGFGLLAVLWLGTTAYAIRLAMARRIAAHRRWMIRSFALTFAAVTLRLYLAPMMLAGMNYAEAIPILAWACWVPNLVIAEWLLARRGRGRVAA